MAGCVLEIRKLDVLSSFLLEGVRYFRSDAALDALAKAAEEKTKNLVLYNYPSFSGAFSALFARLFHDRLNVPCLILPFSSVEPFTARDLCVEGLEKCYFLDFLGPKGFLHDFSMRSLCQIIAFDHRKSALTEVTFLKGCTLGIEFHVDATKSSSTATYEYFSKRLLDHGYDNENMSLFKPEDADRVGMLLRYLADIDLRQWSLPEVRAFKVGISDLRSKVNCVTNQYMYDELSAISCSELIEKGSYSISSRSTAARILLDNVFKLRLGKGLYGECLGVRADGSTNLTDEIGKQLSERSASAGLRPIGAVVYLQRKNLKMCLRTTDCNTDTAEIAKAYGGGGSCSSSSFIIRMDEYNLWRHNEV